MLSVLKGEIQSCISLLCDGVDPNIISPTGAPLLHLALGVEEESQAVALVQLLLVHGADSNSVNKVTGRTALQVAKKSGSSELVWLLKSFGASQQEEVISDPGDDEGEVVRRFNKYIFDTEQHPDRLNNNGAKFLQQIADLFEENIRGVKHDDGQPASRETEDLSLLVSELDKIGFNAGSRAAPLSKPRRLNPPEVCSTPRSTQKLLPCLEVSNISCINAEETFHSFLPDQTGESHITISEEYLIHDR